MVAATCARVALEVTNAFLAAHGFRWCSTRGQGVRLRRGELPKFERAVVRVPRHVTAVIDGVIRDTFLPSWSGRRAVIGYFTRPA